MLFYYSIFYNLEQDIEKKSLSYINIRLHKFEINTKINYHIEYILNL